MNIMKGICITLAFGAALSVAGCAQTTNAQAINLYQPEWGLDNYQQGMRAWEMGDANTAAKLFKDAYTFSDAKAEAMLGLLYVKGSGVFQSAEVGRAYAIAADQRSDFDAFEYYHGRWQKDQDADGAYLIAWILANRFSGHAREDYE